MYSSEETEENPAVRGTINEDNPKKNFLIEEGILFSLIQDMGLVWRKDDKEIRSLMISAQTCAHINYQLWKTMKVNPSQETLSGEISEGSACKI